MKPQAGTPSYMVTIPFALLQSMKIAFYMPDMLLTILTTGPRDV